MGLGSQGRSSSLSWYGGSKYFPRMELVFLLDIQSANPGSTFLPATAVACHDCCALRPTLALEQSVNCCAMHKLNVPENKRNTAFTRRLEELHVQSWPLMDLKACWLSSAVHMGPTRGARLQTAESTTTEARFVLLRQPEHLLRFSQCDWRIFDARRSLYGNTSI